MAFTYTDVTWSPLDIYQDANGNSYAYWDDPNNWSGGVVPSGTNASGLWYAIHLQTPPDAPVACWVTNTTVCGRIATDGNPGNDLNAGILVVTNEANVPGGITLTAGFPEPSWTGFGFPNGPGTLYVGPGCTVNLGQHLWVGNGVGNQGSVTIDGGILNLPNGQLGVGWNGGTNYLTLTNGAKLFLSQWASQTLGAPGNASGFGILNLADNQSSVVVTNNQTGYFQTLTNNHQLVSYGGLGQVTWSYNPGLNITTIGSVAPANPNTPVISTQPVNAVVSMGGTASFNVQISNVAVTYQWLFNGNPLTDGNGISGSQTATLTITGVQQANIGNYSVLATNSSTHVDFIQSSTVGLSTSGINLYPVITINGVPGGTYVTSYATSVNGTYTPFATNTANSFAPFYVVDTSSPLSVTRFYKTVQQ
ncbi:MAG TPA: immunoglobulin domain-containing protein [Verrucomicrobiae bacterium]|nr:immunoglobulin domain-containing protein [Verrucomicrobiae bacterium]